MYERVARWYRLFNGLPIGLIRILLKILANIFFKMKYKLDKIDDLPPITHSSTSGFVVQAVG